MFSLGGKKYAEKEEYVQHNKKIHELLIQLKKEKDKFLNKIDLLDQYETEIIQYQAKKARISETDIKLAPYSIQMKEIQEKIELKNNLETLDKMYSDIFKVKNALELLADDDPDFNDAAKRDYLNILIAQAHDLLTKIDEQIRELQTYAAEELKKESHPSHDVNDVNKDDKNNTDEPPVVGDVKSQRYDQSVVHNVEGTPEAKGPIPPREEKVPPRVDLRSVWEKSLDEVFDRRDKDQNPRKFRNYFLGLPETPQNPTLLWRVCFVICLLCSPITVTLKVVFKPFELLFKVAELASLKYLPGKIGTFFGDFIFGPISSLIRYTFSFNPYQAAKECSDKEARPARLFKALGFSERVGQWVGGAIGGIFSLGGLFATAIFGAPAIVSAMGAIGALAGHSQLGVTVSHGLASASAHLGPLQTGVTSVSKTLHVTAAGASLFTTAAVAEVTVATTAEIYKGLKTIPERTQIYDRNLEGKPDRKLEKQQERQPTSMNPKKREEDQPAPDPSLRIRPGLGNK